MKTLIAFCIALFAVTAKSQVPYVTAATNSPADTYILQRSGASGGHNKWIPYSAVTNAATNVIVRPGIGGITITTNAASDYTVNSTNWVFDARTGGLTNSRGPIEITNSLWLLGPSLIFTNGSLASTHYWSFAQALNGLTLGNDGVNKFSFNGDLGTFGASNFITPTNISIVGNVLIATNTLGQSAWGPAPAGSLWTNDVDGSIRILRPIDQTRMVETYSIGTNNTAGNFLLKDTNAAGLYTTALYGENLSTNTGTRLLYNSQGNIGTIGESIGDNGVAKISGDAAGIYGLADGGMSQQYGVAGLAVAKYLVQTNVGLAGSAVSGGSLTITNVGVYAEVYNVAQGSAVQPNMIGSVFLGDSRNLYVPLLTLGTNGGTVKWQVNADGNLKQVNGAAVGSVMTSDANGVGTWQSATSAGSNAVAVAAGTNITAVTNGGVVTLSVSTNPVVIAGTNVTVQTNGLAYTVNATSSGGSGVGPGTLNYLSRFDSTTTNVVDSFMVQPATNLLIYRSRAAGTAYTNQWTNTWITSTSGSDTNYEGLQIVAGNSTAGQRQHEIKGVLGTANSNAIVPIVLNGHLTIEPNANQLSGHSSSLIYSASGGALGNSSLPFASLDLGSSGLEIVPNGGAANVFALPSSGNTFGLSFETTGIGYWVEATSTWVQVGRYYNLSAGNFGYGLDVGTGGIFGGTLPNTAPTTFFAAAAANTWALGCLNTGASSTNQLLRGANGSGTDHAGDHLALSGGISTGAGTNGWLRLQAAMKGSTGSSLNTLQDKLIVTGDAITLTTNSATTCCTFTVPTSLTVVGGEFSATVEIKDATDVATVHERFAFNAINKAGTVTATNQAVPTITSPLATGSAGVTTVWTISVSGTTCSIKCNATTTGILATTARVLGPRIELDSDGVSVVTFP